MDTSQLPVMPRSLADLEALVGQDIGPTAWHDVTQERINAFADTTGDHQWIHVDPERAASSPLGTTIAHGLYSLSLGPAFSYSLLSFEAFAHSLNYGYDKVRFPAPLPTGSRVRMTLTITSVEQVAGGAQIRTLQTFEREGADKPVAVAESLARVVEGE
ncbi:MaoC family dehydratase [Aeromicrobium phragmitis]|uniref:MaoC family dehydratase n=1 Tax=Aeromicrobium phragmitis TaxID=2478914 RepID=A0A3L8PMT0_9ACTN|nr:MaoC family dehydratase [Aeromicrobium phragmitis]RLV55352.1 MaoC family dehydratase [Aeromicrobium phragmitis]